MHSFGLYDSNHPSDVFVLDRHLKEISGLAYDAEKNVILTHNDEKGIYYELSTDNGKIHSRHKFGKSGDYEAIEVVEDQVIVANNSGKLHFIHKKTKEKTSVSTELKSKNDIEGLCHYKASNKLLMACKGESIDAPASKKIFAYSLSSMSLDDKPFLEIMIEDLERWVTKHKSNYNKISASKLRDRIAKFSPSGISLDNAQKYLYILSARGSAMLIYKIDHPVVDHNSEMFVSLHGVEFFDTILLPQPEGITFDAHDNLYVSTEGQGKSGKLYKFNPLKRQ